MSPTSDRPRQPAGIPTGGQFAASAHAESGVSLGTGQPDQPDQPALDPALDQVIDTYAADVVAQGADGQVAFLRQVGLSDEEILDVATRGVMAEMVGVECHEWSNQTDTPLAPDNYAEQMDRFRFPLRAFDDQIVENVEPRDLGPGQALRLTLHDPLRGAKVGPVEAVLVCVESDYLNPTTRNPLSPGKIRQATYTVITEDGSHCAGSSRPYSDEVVGRGSYERDDAYNDAITSATRHVAAVSYFRAHDPLAEVRSGADLRPDSDFSGSGWGTHRPVRRATGPDDVKPGDVLATQSDQFGARNLLVVTSVGGQGRPELVHGHFVSPTDLDAKRMADDIDIAVWDYEFTHRSYFHTGATSKRRTHDDTAATSSSTEETSR